MNFNLKVTTKEIRTEKKLSSAKFAPLLGRAMASTMVNSLDSGSSGLGLSPGRGHCVVFLSKAL